MNRGKNGQITLFFLLAVVLLFIFGLAFFLLDSFEKKTVAFDKSSIQGYLDGCLRQTAEEGIILLGKQGGRIILGDYVAGPGWGISYALKGNRSMMSPIQEMEGALSFYVDNNINRCFNGFEDFGEQGWSVIAGELKSEATVNRDDVSFRANFPLTVSQGGQNILLQGMSATLPIRLRHIHDSMEEAVLFAQSHGGAIDMSALDALGMNTTLFPYKDALIYRFEDSQSRINNRPYEFFFAMG